MSTTDCRSSSRTRPEPDRSPRHKASHVALAAIDVAGPDAITVSRFWIKALSWKRLVYSVLIIGRTTNCMTSFNAASACFLRASSEAMMR